MGGSFIAPYALPVYSSDSFIIDHGKDYGSFLIPVIDLLVRVLVDAATYLYLIAVLLAVYFLRFDSLPRRSMRWLAVVFASAIIIQAGWEFFLESHPLLEYSALLKWAMSSDIFGGIAMALGCAVYLRAVYQLRVFWLLVVSIVVGALIAYLWLAIYYRAINIESEFLNELEFVNAALLRAVLQGGVVCAAVSGCLGRSARAIGIGMLVGTLLYAIGYGLGVGTGILVPLAFDLKSNHPLSLIILNSIHFGIYLCFPFVLRRFGYFPSTERWQSPLQRVH